MDDVCHCTLETFPSFFESKGHVAIGKGTPGVVKVVLY